MVTLGGSDWNNEWDVVISIIRVMMQLICDDNTGGKASLLRWGTGSSPQEHEHRVGRSGQMGQALPSTW